MHNWTKIDLLQPWRCNMPSMVDHLMTGIIAMAFCARQHLGCRSHNFTLFRLASPFGHGQQPLHRDFFYPRKNRIGKLIYTGFKNTKMNIVITICRLIGSIALKWVISILSCIAIYTGQNWCHEQKHREIGAFVVFLRKYQPFSPRKIRYSEVVILFQTFTTK